METKREVLASMMSKLSVLQDRAGVLSCDVRTGPVADPEDDMLEEEEVPPTRARRGAPALQNDDEDPLPLPIEQHIICLPSNNNAQGDFKSTELKHRKLQAKIHLNNLRDIIADKSFQFSHVMRAAPNKGVRTRSRTAIAKTNLTLSLHVKKYRRCRARMAALGADADTLNTFRILLKEDLKASTAVLRPNMPGSTQLKLPWIWHTSTGHLPAAGADHFVEDDENINSGTLLECESY